MKPLNHQHTDRRHFLKLLGSGVAIIPLTTLTACGGGGEEAGPSAPAANEPASTPPPAQTQPSTAAPTGTGASELVRLSEDDAQAKALGYKHDATAVSKSEQPRYEAGQLCSNCVLYQGGEEWGGCSIFPGKAVAANGWCSAYAPKPSAG